MSEEEYEWVDVENEEDITCIHPECKREVSVNSGIHGMCEHHYAEWYNGYARAYGWTEIEIDG